MLKIILHADKMTTQEAAQDHIMESFAFDGNYKKNMDDFYGYLMSIKSPMKVEIDDIGKLTDDLGRYGLGLIKILTDASKENDNIVFKL